MLSGTKLDAGKQLAFEFADVRLGVFGFGRHSSDAGSVQLVSHVRLGIGAMLAGLLGMAASIGMILSGVEFSREAAFFVLFLGGASASVFIVALLTTASPLLRTWALLKLDAIQAEMHEQEAAENVAAAVELLEELREKLRQRVDASQRATAASGVPEVETDRELMRRCEAFIASIRGTEPRP
ncbi:MAG: hypothetical protein ACKVS9_13575 [Phycisphaerae bacterium]